MSETTAHQGRPPKYKTEEERREAQRRYNREYHKKRRQPRIENDPAYREKINKQRRERYRRKKGFKPKGFGRFAGDADRFARLHDTGGPKRVRAITIDDMADIIGIVPKVLSGWIESEKFPRPVHRTTEGQRVYTVKEADALATALRDALKNRATFRPTDKELISELHSIMLRMN